MTRRKNAMLVLVPSQWVLLVVKLDLLCLLPACTGEVPLFLYLITKVFCFLLLFSDSVLGILVCTALSAGLVDKWVCGKPESSTRASTAGKKSGQHANKKGKDVHNEQVHIDPEGCSEIKEALEVSVLAEVWVHFSKHQI